MSRHGQRVAEREPWQAVARGPERKTVGHYQAHAKRDQAVARRSEWGSPRVTVTLKWSTYRRSDAAGPGACAGPTQPARSASATYEDFFFVTTSMPRDVDDPDW
ncbi:hypothetical protein MRX96_038733 [Rhipicephalus microplus]